MLTCEGKQGKVGGTAEEKGERERRPTKRSKERTTGITEEEEEVLTSQTDSK